MMQTIDSRTTAFDEPTFDNPEAAIRGASQINAARQRPDYLPHKGRTIKSVDFCDDAFRLNLDNGKSLCFGFVGDVVDVTVGDDLPSAPLGPTALADTVVVRLHNGHEYVWERREIIQSLAGNVFQNIFYGRSILFLYVSNIWILMLFRSTDINSGLPFLKWSVTD